MRSFGPLWLLAMCSLAMCSLACEPRVEEPGSRTVASAPSAGATTTAGARAPRPSPPEPRCVEATTAEPKRPLTTGVDPKCPDDPTGPPPLSLGKVHFETGELFVDVEVAREPEHRQRGLMYRKTLAETAGMLFVFEQPRVQTFWMKNTCLPLDMLFLDRDGLIVGIEENVPTMNTETYHVNCPSQLVLEVNAGWSRRHGVKAGQRVRFDGVAGL
jgi:hypothetical protein